MNQYTLKKMIEECGEVVQAAAKVLLHGRSREGALIGEMADAQLIIDRAYKQLSTKQQALFAKTYEDRAKREDRKGKL